MFLVVNISVNDAAKLNNEENDNDILQEMTFKDVQLHLPQIILRATTAAINKLYPKAQKQHFSLLSKKKARQVCSVFLLFSDNS